MLEELEELANSRKPHVRTAHSTRNGLLCVLIFVVTFAAACPLAEMSFEDDWSYIKSAQVFAETGHLVYNGWATAMLGWQIPWGALFIKLCGFSFMAVKLSTLPIAAASLFLFHAILRNFGATPRNAVIGTLTLGLSPLFLPLAASYMTDVPGLLVILVCLYCCERAARAGGPRSAVAWLCLAAISNVLGGTVRQIAWLGALVLVPSTGWFLRKRRGVMMSSFALWLCSIGAVFWCMRWFGLQPYSITQQIRASSGDALFLIFLTLHNLCSELFCLLLMVFPVLLVWLSKPGAKRLLHLFGLSCVFLAPFLLGVLPPNVLYKMLSTHKDLGSFAPTPLTVSLEAGIALIAFLSLFACISFVQDRDKNPSLLARPASSRNLYWLIPLPVSYFLLLIPRAVVNGTFDRYVLGLMPFGILGLIWLYQEYVGPNLPPISVAILTLYALVSIAGTHDWFAWQRARLAAISELRAAGIPRTRIQGGVEYDGWTQIEHGGHINDERIKVPADAYEAPQVADTEAGDCKYMFLPSIPSVHPRFTVGVGPDRCYAPSGFPPVHYTTWLPPFSRTIVVKEITQKNKWEEGQRYGIYPHSVSD